MHDYEMILPGVAERLVQMVEKSQQQDHRMELEALKVKTNDVLIKRIFGLAALTLILLASSFAVHKGNTGAVVAIMSGAAVISAFLGYRSQKAADPKDEP